MKILPVFLLAVIFLSGCATSGSQLFGIAMDPDYASSFEIERYSKDRTVRYSFRGIGDSNITAYANTYSYWGLDITVYNNSDRPISTNYFGDKFTLITTYGNTYVLKKVRISNYPSTKGGYINPGESATYELKLPDDLCPFKKRHVRRVICDLGTGLDRTYIVLKPLPDIEDK